MPNQGVKEASTKTLPVLEGPSFAVALDVAGPADAASVEAGPQVHRMETTWLSWCTSC